MEGPTAADADYLDRLSQTRLITGRPTSSTSLIVDHTGRRCVVAFTDVQTMTTWWRQRSNKRLGTATWSVRDLAERWGAPTVDLLVDPDTPGQRYVPIGTLRAHLGLAAVLTDGDGSEPLRFAGFGGSLYGSAKGLVLVPVAVLVTVMGLASGQAGLALLGLAMVVVTVLLARSTFRELRAGLEARRRLSATRASSRQAAPSS